MSSPATIMTPCSKTEIAYRGRWNNPIYVREYQRLKRREKYQISDRQIKVNDDNTTRHHITDSYNYYQPRPKRLCEVCRREVYEGQWLRHVGSSTHKKRTQSTAVAPSDMPQSSS